MASMNKDIELHEIKTEVTRTTDGNVIDSKSSVKCGPCFNGRHKDCKLLQCSCAKNNHQG